MNLLTKISFLIILLLVVAAAVVLPLVFHFRNNEEKSEISNQTLTKNNSTISPSSTRTTTTTTVRTSQLTSTIYRNETLSSTIITTTIRTTQITRNTTDVQTNYSSSLRNVSHQYCRVDPCSTNFYYFQAIQLIVNQSSSYTIETRSNIDTFGYLYSPTFNPLINQNNLLSFDDDSSSSTGQFLIRQTLSNSQIYVVIVTTYNPSIIGSFNLLVNGPRSVSLTSLNISSNSSVLNSSSTIISSYSSGLTNSSSMYCRYLATCSTTFYYYQSFELNLTTNGSYIITTNSSLDTYGCLYNTTFNSNNSLLNLIGCNDDGPGSTQFSLSFQLEKFRRYILVVTTYGSALVGPFSLLIIGPDLTGIIPISS